jgi:membrane-bound serine protease (ClpP class)
MTAFGIALLVVGAALLVAEAHLPTAGALGVAGVAALGAGGWLALSGADAAAGVAIAVGVGLALVGAAFVALVVLQVARTRRRRVRGGPEALVGHLGTARGAERVFVDGALWRARPSWPGEAPELHAGDPVVVERVTGLTLCVRRADPWELEA